MYSKELLELNFSSNIIRMFQSVRIRWAGHVACMVENKNVLGFWWENMRERDNFEDKDVDGTQNPNRYSRNRMDQRDLELICLWIDRSGIARAERDGTRAETRFRLSSKRTSPFKSVGGRQFGRLLAADVCASAGVMLDRPHSEVAGEYWLPTPFASFPFTSPPVRHRVPPGSERALRYCRQSNEL